jgi:hypothetical protein
MYPGSEKDAPKKCHRSGLDSSSMTHTKILAPPRRLFKPQYQYPNRRSLFKREELLADDSARKISQ